MANTSFVIPLTPEGLLKSDSDARYSIVQYTDVSHLSDKELHKNLDSLFKNPDVIILLTTLTVIYSKIDGSAVRIVESDTFDFLFSCLHKFNSVGTSCKSSIIVILENGIKSITNKLLQLFQKEDQYRQAALQYRNALKMYIYLLRWFISEEEKKNQENNSGRAKKKKTTSESKWSSDKQKESTLSVLVGLLDIDLKKLWNNDCPEEDFLNLFTKISIDLFSVSSNAKSKPVKKCLVEILGLLIRRYQQRQNVSSAVMEALFKFEHVVMPIAELLQHLLKEYPDDDIVGDFMGEIGRMDPGSNRADASGAKNIANFIVAIAELMPRALLPYVSLIIPHLANDSYTLRNGIIQALGHIVCNGFSDSEREEETKHRDQFLEILEERFLDTTSYTRSKVIQTWILLVQAKKIPLKFLPSVTDAALGRLEDKATQVRKYAIQLLYTLLEHNPFGFSLKLSEYTKKYEEAEAQLKDKTEKLTQKAKEASQASPEPENPPSPTTNKEEEEHSEGETDEDVMSDDDEKADEEQEENEVEIDFTETSDEEREKTEEEKKLEKAVNFFRDAVQFITRIHKSMPTVSKLLGSKVNADVLESIQFFVKANEFKIENAGEGIKSMLVLIWSKEAATKEAVIEAYKKLYITPPSSLPDQPKLADIYIANNFVKLVLSASTTEITSLEELVSTLITKNLIHTSTIQCLWDFFAMRVPNVTARQSKGALIILSMAANANPEIVRSKISLLVSVGLGPRWKEDEDIARYACIALQKLVQQTKEDRMKSEPPTRFDPSHSLFERLRCVLLEDSQTVSKWFPAAEQAINAIYSLAERPDSLCTPIVKQIAHRLLSGDTNHQNGESTGQTNNVTLSKFLFVIGHVALKHLQYLEDIQNELTRRKNLSSTNKGKESANPSLEEEIGINAGVDDTEEYIQSITQNEIVLKNLLGSFSPLIVAVCSNEKNKFNDHMVRSAAVLALCKYMCVSSEFCEKHLRLIFTLLERAPEPWIRSDVIIALGDLASRFPNQVDAWTPKLYARLRDDDAGVRKNTLMVLSHLILNEMVRVKGQISEIALCIEDNNEQISDLAKLFFNELNNKGNCLYSIYNILPDIVSNLSAAGVSSDTFRSIMKYLFAFIEKERETETLIERLCQKRMRTCSDPHQLADIAYCLSLLNYNERGVKKISENFNCYQAALVHDNVFGYFTTIIQKAKKNCKAENKAAVEELEMKIIAQHNGDEEAVTSMEDEAQPSEGKPPAKRATRRTPRKSPARKPRTKTPTKSPPARRSKRAPSRTIVYSDSDEEEEDNNMVLDDDSE